MTETSEQDTGTSRRRHTRLLLSDRQTRRLQFCATRPGEETTEILVDLSAVDLSIGGLGFSTPGGVTFGTAEELPRGTKLDLTFPIVGSQDKLTITGQVLWASTFTVPLGGKQTERFRYGVQFVPGTEELAAYLVAILKGETPPPPQLPEAQAAAPEPEGKSWWQRLFS